MGGVIQSKSRVIYLAILFSAICLIVVLLPPHSAYATDDSITWSWSDKEAQVLFSKDIPSLADFKYCSTYYLPKNLNTEKGSVQMCMFGDGNFKVGNYFLYTPNFRGFKYAVGIPGDTTMYELRGMECYSYDGCLYIPERDMLVSKEYLVNGLVRSLVIYKNFSKRLTLQYDGATNSKYFSFNTYPKDYVLQSTDGYQWPINSVGASDNGKWLGVEFRERGFGLLNLETFEWKRVSKSWMSYGHGLDSLPQLAVSNDGAHIAIAGINSGLEFVDITPDCGENIADMIPDMKIYNVLCRRVYLPIDKVFDDNRFKNGYAPKFNEDGSRLRLYMDSSISEQKEVIFGAPGKTTVDLDYLALGDSYTSGEGETSDRFYQPYTNDKYEKCHLSSRSYPYAVASLFNIDPSRAKSVACSGATTADIVGEDTSYQGQGNRLGDEGLKIDKSMKSYYQTYARENFIPGRTHQENFLSVNMPKVVTIGIGGNDAGFMKKLANCVGPGTCSWTAASEGREKSGTEIKNLFPRLVDTYSKLHDDSPGSYIYAVGYPRAVNTTGDCGPITNLLLSKDERVFMDESIRYLNQIIQAAARRAGIGYIDVSDFYGDQALCGGGQPSAMNAVRLGGEIPILKIKFIGGESFHPTPEGHALTAAKIAQKYPNLFSPNYCANPLETACPELIEAPALTDYWLEDGIEHNYPQQRNVGYIDNKNLDGMEAVIGLNIPDSTFRPNSTVKIEVHSETQELGEFTASETGGLQAHFTLPRGLDGGYHSLHALGKSLAGNDVDIYDFLQIGQDVSNENHVDPLTETSNVAIKDEYSSNNSPMGVGARATTDSGESISVLGEANQTSPLPYIGAGVVLREREGKNLSTGWPWMALIAAGVGAVVLLVLRLNRKPA